MSERIDDLTAKLVEQGKRLAQIGEVAGVGEKAVRDDEARKIAVRSSELVRGIASLGKEQNVLAVSIIFRTVFESLIVLLWVEISEENATYQAESGLTEFARIAKINTEQKNLKIKERATGEDSSSEFLKSEIFQGLKRSKNVVDMAKEAEISFLYDVFYRFQSMSTHGTSINEEIETEEKIWIELQAVIAISNAIGHVALRWLIHRKRTDNQTLSQVLGLVDR